MVLIDNGHSLHGHNKQAYKNMRNPESTFLCGVTYFKAPQVFIRSQLIPSAAMARLPAFSGLSATNSIDKSITSLEPNKYP